MGCGASASQAEQPVGSAASWAKWRRRQQSTTMRPGTADYDLYPLPVLLNKKGSQDAMMSKLKAVSGHVATLEKVYIKPRAPPPTRCGSFDEDIILKEVLISALVEEMPEVTASDAYAIRSSTLPLPGELPSDAHADHSSSLPLPRDSAYTNTFTGESLLERACFIALGVESQEPTEPVIAVSCRPKKKEPVIAVYEPTATTVEPVRVTAVDKVSTKRKSRTVQAHHGASASGKPSVAQEWLQTRQTAATKVQKNFRGHRIRLKVPEFRHQRLETVEEAAEKRVSFVESPTAAAGRRGGRLGGRKSTGFVRKEDLSPVLDSQRRVEIVMPDLPRSSSWNLRAERKLTGFVKNEDLPEPEPESEKSVVVIASESPNNRLSQRKGTRFNFESGEASLNRKEPCVVVIVSESPNNRHRQRKGTRFNFDSDEASP